MYWYNGHPSAENNKKALKVKGIENVIIVGNGNVAIDVARIFLRKPQDFRNGRGSPTGTNGAQKNPNSGDPGEKRRNPLCLLHQGNPRAGTTWNQDVRSEGVTGGVND